MKIRLNNNSLFYAMFSIFMALIYVKHVFEMPIPTFAFLLVSAAISFVGNKNHIIAMCMCCVPLSTSLESYHIIVICLFIYIIKYANGIKVSIDYFWIILLLIWELLHCINEEVGMISAIVFIFPYVLCVLVINENSHKIDYLFICRIIAICTLCMCFVVFSKMIIDSGFNIVNALSNMKRFGMFSSIEEGSIYFNPNALGYFCLFAVIGLIQKIEYETYRVSDLIIISTLIICGLLTLSRTYVVCLVITIVLFGFAKKGTLKGKVKTLFVIAGMMLIISVILVKVFPEIINDLMMRFLVEDISNGRTQLIKIYNQYIGASMKNLMWGTGLVARKLRIDNYFGSINMQVPHNGVQELIVVWGTLGMFIWFVFMFGLIIKSRKINPSQGLINYIPLIVLMIKVQAGQMVSSYYTMLMFPLAFLSLCYNFKKNNLS